MSRSAVALTFVLAAAVLAAAVSAGAQPTAPYPVDNFNRRSVFQEIGAPGPFMAVGGRTLFVADSPSQGDELWVTDGTAAGTRLLLDLCPGQCLTRLEVHVVAPEIAYFEPTFPGPPGQPDIDGGLWRSDGTLAGTFPVTSHDVSPVGYVASTGRFFFRMNTAAQGVELWSTDGTPEGTGLLKDIHPGPGSSEPSGGAAIGDQVVFAASAPASGRELWVSDGTAAGTRLLADLDGAGSSDPESFRQAGSFVLFAAGSPFLRDLWTTDGTAAGTRRLQEGLLFSNVPIGEPVLLGARAYFVIEDFPNATVWSSDGTEAGTRRVSPEGFSGFGLRRFDGRLFFSAASPGGDREPWVTDGSPGGTRRFMDLCPGPCNSSPEYLGVAGGRLVFVADDGTTGRELWSTDGTVGGTRLLRDDCPGDCDAGLEMPLEVGSKLFVSSFNWVIATDGTPGGTVNLTRTDFPLAPLGAVGTRALIPSRGVSFARELVVSDGTVAGTTALTDFDPREDESSDPSGLVELGGEVLFSATLDQFEPDASLLASRGRPGASRTVLGGGQGFGRTHRVSDRVFFVGALQSSNSQLWVTDGSTAGTLPLGEPPGFVVDRPWGSLGEDLLAFLHPPDGVSRISGPPLDVTPLADIQPPHLFGALPEKLFVPLDGRVLFPEEDSFWATDGTPGGTVRVGHQADFLSQVSGWTLFGDELFYLNRFEGLWATDGIAGHARRVCPALWPTAVTPRHLFSVGERLVFSVSEPRSSTEPAAGLWVSDGQSGCELAVPGVILDPSGFLPGIAAVLGDRLFFAADDGLHGTELWVTNGTPAGTALFADLRPGPGESRPHRMRVIGDRLFFTATDGAHGYELWSTDGTPAGTVLLGDVAPGALSSHPDELTAAGDTLLFSADDGSRGRELWAVPLATPDCGDAETLCLQQDRFRIQVRWRDQRTGQVGSATALPFPGSDRTGMFWFFDAANIELILKVLDGGPVNGFHWVFYGALSEVEYWITVTDAVAGTSRTYRNPPGEICGRGDTAAFPSQPASGASASSAPLRGPERGWEPVDLVAAGAATPRTAPGSGGCQPDAETLCLHGGRFRVTADWHDQRSGDSGVGGAIAGTDKSGFFWFFNSSNVELVIKVLDGRSINSSFWVFYGALSDVEYTIQVVDTQTTEEETYINPPGEICGRADTTAF